MTAPRSAPPFELQPAAASDFESLLTLRLRAMRESLERIGRYDEQRARERLAAGFAPEHTQHILAGGQRVGFLVLKRHTQALRLEHLYIDPQAQDQGLGSAVLDMVCERADRELLRVELVALKGSDANRFYLRHGFVAVGEGEWDIDYLREPLTPSAGAVRALWSALQRRDWTAARGLLADDLRVHWWTSGERFQGADAFIEVQRRIPDGWTIHLLELGHMQDGRVLALVRVDQGPHRYFATSISRVDDGRIVGIDEYWARSEPPPAWRSEKPISGRSHFDVGDDPRAWVP